MSPIVKKDWWKSEKHFRNIPGVWMNATNFDIITVTDNILIEITEIAKDASLANTQSDLA